MLSLPGLVLLPGVFRGVPPGRLSLLEVSLEPFFFGPLGLPGLLGKVARNSEPLLGDFFRALLGVLLLLRAVV